jgi:hypothetical protein
MPQLADSTNGANLDELPPETHGRTIMTNQPTPRERVDAAKNEAGGVAAEAGRQTKNLLHQGQDELRQQVGGQQQKAAQGLRSLSEDLRGVSTNSDGHASNTLASLADQAAHHAENVAQWLENRNPGDVVDEVKSFARQRPGTFLLAAAGAGLLVGRLGRSLQANASSPTSPAPVDETSPESVNLDVDATSFGQARAVAPEYAATVPSNVPSGTLSNAPGGGVL